MFPTWRLSGSKETIAVLTSISKQGTPSSFIINKCKKRIQKVEAEEEYRTEQESIESTVIKLVKQEKKLD